MKMLVDEIRNCPDTVQNYRVISVFFGGGTPSLLTGEQIGRLMDTVREIFTLDEDAEITMEMNPGTVTEEKLRKYRQAGVNRLSIGLQSVNDEELRLLGRIHTYEEFREAYHLARANGFSNINVDLISAIPGQTVESWRRTLEQVMALSPEHISAYSLILEEGTTFYKKYVEDEAKEGPKLPDEDAERQMYWDTETLMEKNGYHRYEISNYAKEGYACRHNLGYWDENSVSGIWNWCGISGSRGSDWKMQEVGRKNESLHEPGSVKGVCTFLQEQISGRASDRN